MNFCVRRPIIWAFGILFFVLVILNALGIKTYYRTSLDDVIEDVGGNIDAQVTARIKNITNSETGVKVTLDECVVIIATPAVTATDIGSSAAADSTQDGKYSPHGLVAYIDEESCSCGDTVTFSGKIKSFDEPDNPGEFNSWQYYRCRGIDYCLYPDSMELQEEGRGIRAFLYKVRQSLYDSIDRVCESEEEAALFKAILFGDKSSLDEDTYATFQVCGIAHILAVGGLHLTIIGGIILRLLRRLGLSRLMSSALADLVILLFVIMIDGSTSAWRAYIMFTLSLIAPLISRTYDILSALGFAGILILLLQPLYVMDCAFQLSFAAIIGVGVIYPRLRNIAEELRPRDETGRKKDLGFIYYKVITPLTFSISIHIMTIPVMLRNFYTLSLYGIFLNLLIIPFLSIVLVSIFSSALFTSVFLAGVAHYFFKLLLACCSFVEKLPYASVTLGSPPLWKIFIYYLLVTIIVIILDRPIAEFIRNRLLRISNPVIRGRTLLASYEIPIRKISKRFLAVLLIIPAFLFLVPFSNVSHNLSLSALYVGQGDSTIITLPNGHALIIDAGSSSKKDVSKSVVLPYLKYSALTNIDMIFLSHPDIDHINGVKKLLEDPYVTVGGVATAETFASAEALDEIRATCASLAIPFYYMNAGDDISFSSSEVSVTAISPLVTASSTKGSSKNDGSLVLRLTFGDFSALFTGDISSEEETEIIKTGVGISSTYLKCPHHGSKYSSSEEFLAAIHPLITTISAGRGNSYGHPTKEALERIAASGSSVFVTKTQGAILTTVTPDGRISTRTFK